MSNIYDAIERSKSVLKLDISSQEFANLALEHNMGENQLEAVRFFLEYLEDKKKKTAVETILKLSRLPIKNPKTFDNFDFSLIQGKDAEKLKNIRSLATIHNHRNVAFIGPAGTGKTHLAQAYGYECCINGIKAYFIKASELRDKFTTARKNGKTVACLNGLMRQACLIIDEIGHCEFDKENTRLFFDLIDRRYNREGAYNTVFTSNKKPSLWKDNFNENDALLCALDRIFDDASVFMIQGESFRGKRRELFQVETTKKNN